MQLSLLAPTRSLMRSMEQVIDKSSKQLDKIMERLEQESIKAKTERSAGKNVPKYLMFKSPLYAKRDENLMQERLQHKLLQDIRIDGEELSMSVDEVVFAKLQPPSNEISIQVEDWERAHDVSLISQKPQSPSKNQAKYANIPTLAEQYQQKEKLLNKSLRKQRIQKKQLLMNQLQTNQKRQVLAQVRRAQGDLDRMRRLEESQVGAVTYHPVFRIRGQ